MRSSEIVIFIKEDAYCNIWDCKVLLVLYVLGFLKVLYVFEIKVC